MRRCARNNLGVIYKERGELIKAQEEYALAIQYGPKTVSIQHLCLRVDCLPCPNRNSILFVLMFVHCTPQSVARENMAVILTDMGSHLKLAGNIETALER